MKNLGNLAKESLDPAEMSVNRAFCSVCERGGTDPLSAWQSGHHIEGDETRVGFGQIKFNLVFSVFVYKILLVVTALIMYLFFTFLYLMTYF